MGGIFVPYITTYTIIVQPKDILHLDYDTYNEEYHGPYKEMALSRLEHDKKETNYSFNLNYYQIS
jgi:hypothetical protein